MENQFLQNVSDAIGVDQRKLELSDRFRDYPEWDSLAFLSLISMIDDEYEIVIDGESFKRLETLADVFAEITARKA